MLISHFGIPAAESRNRTNSYHATKRSTHFKLSSIEGRVRRLVRTCMLLGIFVLCTEEHVCTLEGNKRKIAYFVRKG